jgi:hypothetical protein
MKKLKAYFHKVTSFMIALMFLNLCMDMPDNPTNSKYSIGEQNPVESIGEYVLEHLLKIENAVPETDDREQEGKTSKNIKLFYSTLVESTVLFNGFESQISSQDILYSSITFDLNTPPPEFS